MDWSLPYPSRRYPVGADCVVAASQPLAVQAGVAAMHDGGNAVDAAIAAAAVLTVVEPTSNGIGGDLFAIVWDGSRLHGLNASGRSPARLEADRLIAAGGIPLRGWDSVTVPGAVSGWVALHGRFARLSFDRLLAPAVRHAGRGFLVGPVTAAAWASSARVFADFEDFAPFLPGGRAPAPGERFAFPDQAHTLEAVGRTHGEAFYRGFLAEQTAAHAAAAGAPLTTGDLADHQPEWVETVHLAFGDTVAHELPPNGQGLAALEALGLLARHDLAALDPDGADAIHLQAEAMKQAFADAHAHIADPEAMRVDPAALLDTAHLGRRASAVDPRRAVDPVAASHGFQGGGTVYLCTADGDGMMVSLIQSNFHGFGSGIVVPGTGIALHNRGAGFTTDARHPNVVAPRKRPFHTIIPGMATSRDGVPTMAFGVMGGHMQPQGHVQLILRTGVWGQNPQAALDAPRWRVEGSLDLALEEGVAQAVRRELEARGHRLVDDMSMGGFGGGQIIQRCSDGWLAASDPRKEGHAAGF
ncbi:MAG: gamma-glutamyltransferase [Nitriliruptorales bacterium]|nr:gamma-glutamyltransferase [Nitriliruptorales bacterium]